MKLLAQSCQTLKSQNADPIPLVLIHLLATQSRHTTKSHLKNHDDDIVKKLVDYPNKIRVLNDELAASEKLIQGKLVLRSLTLQVQFCILATEPPNPMY